MREAATWARRWLFDVALPLWLKAGVAPVGFHDQLDDSGAPLSAPLRARVQTRQVYVFAEAGALGWSGPWREVVEHGSAFLLEYGESDAGLFPCCFDAEGRALPADLDLYDQAFALFAHAHAYRALGAPAHRAAAERLMGRLQERQGRVDGGFEDASPPTPTLRANPHMHLLEAMLAWAERDPSSLWRDAGRDLATLALSRFTDPSTGRLREFFDREWNPAPGEAGEQVEPGHQFEWVWLLHRATALGIINDSPAIGRMAEAATATGVDRRRGVAVNVQRLDGAWSDAEARLWPQTERIKAALAMAERSTPGDRDRWLAEADAALKGLRLFLDTPAPGLWRDLMRVDGSLVEEPVKASSLYHIVGALSAVIRSSEAA